MPDPDKLSVRGACFGYPRLPTFLGPVDVSVPPGRMLGIVGPNGAGKSTLLRLMAGLLKPRSGMIVLDGRPVADLPPRRRALLAAFLPQRSVAPEALTAEEVVLLGRFPRSRFHFFDSPADRRVAEEAMRTTDTSAFSGRPLGMLSGGEQQRVHLAAALAGEPGILLLDEPTTALDVYHQLHIFEIVKSLSRERGMAIIVVTHDLNLAGRFCDDLLLLDAGRVVATGSPGDVLQPEVLGRVYGVGFQCFSEQESGHRWILPVARGLRA